MTDEKWIHQLEEDGLLINSIQSLGWALWLFSPDGKNLGFVNEFHLRKIADEIEARNKPFWDEYERYCRESE